MSSELNIQRRGFGIRYDSLGTPYTGKVETRYRNDNTLLRMWNYENGLILDFILFNASGDTVHFYEYGYISDSFQVIREIKNGVLIKEWMDSTPDGKLGVHREWHQNGQLKFEGQFRGNKEYQGLMTLYEEEGNLLKQERYENGILIETIK